MMNLGKFTRETIITFSTRIFALLAAIGTSVVLARTLGPQGQGYYSLAVLFPSVVVTFFNFGIGPATVYYVARKEFEWGEILGNNLVLSMLIGGIGVLVGLIIVCFFQSAILPGVPQKYLLLAIWLIPLNLFYSYIRQMLLGAQYIKKYNYTQIARAVLFFVFILSTLVVLRTGVPGAIIANSAAWLFVDVFTFRLSQRVAGEIRLRPNIIYIKKSIAYGLQSHLSNVLSFLNYRVDVFLVNVILNPAAAGLYSVGVGLAEQLWIISSSAAMILFPRVAAETDSQRLRSFTPLVARSVFWVSALGALTLFFLSHWIILLLYSTSFLPAVHVLRALLVGVVALSVGRVFAHDIAGRGHPELNVYTALASAITNVILNLLWLPQYGIVGAAWASTVSYTISFLGALFFYCRLSENYWAKVLLPRKQDWKMYFEATKILYKVAFRRTP